MADQPRYPDTGEDAGPGPGREPITTRQRWTRVLLVLTVVVLLAVMIILHVTGTFGPGSHG